MTRDQPASAWCIKTASGYLLVSTARSLRRDAIAEMDRDGSPPWAYWKRLGYRAVRVTITEKGPQ